MKTKLLILSIPFIFVTIFSGCSTGNVANLNADLFRQTYKSKGVIRNVDPAAGTVTIDHEDIPGYMTAMEMTNPVADPSLLTAVKAGDKVDFEILRDGSKITFTKFTKTGETKIIDGAAIFAANCAVCHGPKGEGEKRGIPLISGHALDHTEKDFIERVRNGKENRMLPFRDKLSEDEIAAVVTYVRTVLQAGLISDPKEGHKH
ncbi:MAG: copper-binding protein [Pyrinomonadaceae bacterium]|nr:copper-binding protein [Pyrinomonadaceae bacterium]MBP6213487.1 copper-binding protein [Pyrinomonadaceae bacterium]